MLVVISYIGVQNFCLEGFFSELSIFDHDVQFSKARLQSLDFTTLNSLINAQRKNDILTKKIGWGLS